MTDKFTPGPWRAEGYKQIIDNDSRGTTLAIHPGDSREYGIDEVRANARLIAASPELLEALRECCELIAESIDAEYLHEDSQPGCRALLARCRAAIAKATR